MNPSVPPMKCTFHKSLCGNIVLEPGCGRLPQHLHLDLTQMSTATVARQPAKCWHHSQGSEAIVELSPHDLHSFPAVPSRSRLQSPAVSLPHQASREREGIGTGIAPI